MPPEICSLKRASLPLPYAHETFGKSAESRVSADEKLSRISSDIETYLHLAKEESDVTQRESVLRDIERELDTADQYVAQLETETLLAGESDRLSRLYDIIRKRSAFCPLGGGISCSRAARISGAAAKVEQRAIGPARRRRTEREYEAQHPVAAGSSP